MTDFLFYYLLVEIEYNLTELYKENPFLHDMGNEDYKKSEQKRSGFEREVHQLCLEVQFVD